MPPALVAVHDIPDTPGLSYTPHILPSSNHWTLDTVSADFSEVLQIPHDRSYRQTFHYNQYPVCPPSSHTAEYPALLSIDPETAYPARNDISATAVPKSYM